jgi:hypothetical protein
MIQGAIEQAMSFYKNNKTATAQSLGISIRTLDTRLERYKKDKIAHEQRFDAEQQRREEFHRRQRAIPANGGFDNTATPSVHAAEAQRRRAQALPPAKSGNGAAGMHVPGEGVQAEPVADVAAK